MIDNTDQIVFLNCEIKKLKEVFPSFVFEIGKLGRWYEKGVFKSNMWGSIFVIDSKGISIGRLIYEGHIFYRAKAYGENKGFPLHDFFFMYRMWRRIGILPEDLKDTKKYAKQLIAEIKSQQEQWRLDHPVEKRRKKIKGLNEDYVVSQLLGILPLNDAIKNLWCGGTVTGRAKVYKVDHKNISNIEEQSEISIKHCDEVKIAK